jgi:GNAT superfamily N-acetyltransferase
VTAALGSLVHTAHADAWAVAAGGRPDGAVADLGGVRTACSGTPFGQYNGADLLDPAVADPARVAAWWAARGTPWAWRVPASVTWPEGWPGGELLVRQRLAGLAPSEFRAAPVPAGTTVRRAAPGDLDVVVALDVAAFGGPEGPSRNWLAGLLGNERVEVALVQAGGVPVATAFAVRSDGAAGPAVLLGGVAVAAGARRRGVGAGLSSWLLGRAFARGARLAHLQPDDERAARVYARLGFTEVDGLDVRGPA